MKDFPVDDPKSCGDMILRPLVLGGVITKVYEYATNTLSVWL
jgi:hypothetical protein